MAIAEPNFIDRDPAQITSEMIAQYEDASGRVVSMNVRLMLPKS